MRTSIVLAAAIYIEEQGGLAVPGMPVRSSLAGAHKYPKWDFYGQPPGHVSLHSPQPSFSGPWALSKNSRTRC